MNESNNSLVRPFLRWAGGKRWLMKILLKIIPEDYKVFHEPFLGAANLFFALNPPKAYLSDINSELILTYNQLRLNYSNVISHLKQIKDNKKNYYNVRQNIPQNLAARAARFIFLNKTCWNGLYRENREGKFNVPYGYKVKTEIYDESNLMNVSKVLKNATVKSDDFESILKNSNKGDLVYLDPPYTVAHQNNGFITYNSKIFSWTDQERLASVIKELDSAGCSIILSNAYHKNILRLYSNYKCKKVNRMSIIGRNPSSRRKINESLITNF